MKSRLNWYITLVCLTALLSVVAGSGCAKTSQKEIKIGLAYDLTGPTSAGAQAIIFEGFTDYIKYINPNYA